MLTEQDIRQILFDTLENIFEIETEKLNDDANLYEDLEIDSIDAIDLIDHIKKKTGYKLQAEDFRHVRTVREVIAAVLNLQEQRDHIG